MVIVIQLPESVVDTISDYRNIVASGKPDCRSELRLILEPVITYGHGREVMERFQCIVPIENKPATDLFVNLLGGEPVVLGKGLYLLDTKKNTLESVANADSSV